MLYMIVENFRDGDPVPVYRRFRDQGRLAPECENPGLLAQWTARWKDLIDFEIIPVVTSADAVASVAPRL